jgi:hypothetical protein
MMMEEEREGVHHMPSFIKGLCQIFLWLCTGTLLAVGLSFSMLSSASAQDITVSEQSFGCILDWPKVRNTRFKHEDPAKLKEAMRIFRESEPDKEYPVGTILQLVPFEAMVKHPREKFPKSNGWEFFALEVSEAGTKIRDRGDDHVVNLLLGASCQSCHQPAAKFDFVCEKGHGCAPLSIDDKQIAEFQKADLRCTNK